MAVVVAAPLLLLSLLIVATVIILVTRKARQVHSRLPLPPSPPGVPLIGHLHLLGFMPHVGLRNLAMKYGDFMVVRLGAVPTLVISSPRAAMEILRFRTQDSIFASRPTSTAATALLGGPVDVAFAAYGDEWRRAKKILTTTLLSFRRGRESEMARAMARISDAAAGHEALDMGKLLHSLSMAMVCRAVFGPAFNMDGRCQQLQDLVRSTGALVAGYSALDFFPALLSKAGFVRRFVCGKAAKLRSAWDGVLDIVLNSPL